jgi:hypothetical protein
MSEVHDEKSAGAGSVTTPLGHRDSVAPDSDSGIKHDISLNRVYQSMLLIKF